MVQAVALTLPKGDEVPTLNVDRSSPAVGWPTPAVCLCTTPVLVGGVQSKHTHNHINHIRLQSVDVEALFQEVFKGGKTEEDFLATIDALEAWCVSHT